MSRVLGKRSYGTILAVVFAVAVGASAFIVDARRAEAEGLWTADSRALENMSSLKAGVAPEARAGDYGGRLAGLPPPENGVIRRLFTARVDADVAINAWVPASGEVCFKSSFGSAGCFSEFREPFVFRVSERDELGSGKALLVWGLVADSVAGVSATVDGVDVSGVIENNAAVIELPSAGTLPDQVSAVTITLRDGERRVIPHDIALPREIRKRVQANAAAR